MRTRHLALLSSLLGVASLAEPSAAQSVDLAESIKAHTKTKPAAPSKPPPPRATKPKAAKSASKSPPAHKPIASSKGGTPHVQRDTAAPLPDRTVPPPTTPTPAPGVVGDATSTAALDATATPSAPSTATVTFDTAASASTPATATPTTTGPVTPDSMTTAPETSASPDATPKPATNPLQLALFVDAYVAWQTSGSGTLATLSGHRAFSGQGATLRAENGFSLAFLGFDASYDAGSFGAVANLRFGEGAPIYHYHANSDSDLDFGVEHLTQAYAFWRPLGALELDLGMFSTPFGAEVLESWRNANYTRGALYYYAQPAWHTGFKAKWDLGKVSLVGFIADGTNNLSETQQNGGLDQTPTLGAQAVYAPNEALSFALGGLFTLDGYHNDDAGFDAFLDLLATLKLGAASFSFDADTILTRKGAPDGSDRHFWGASLIAGYALTDDFALALRGEYLHDDASYGGGNEWQLGTATLTADYRPIPHLPNLIVRWDNRWEKSNQHVFGLDAKGTADTADDVYTNAWFESVIGVVVTTAP
jgi:hypothetical protein